MKSITYCGADGNIHSSIRIKRKSKLTHLKTLFALLTILGVSGTVIALGSDDMKQLAIILSVSIFLIVIGSIGVCAAERRLEK